MREGRYTMAAAAMVVALVFGVSANAETSPPAVDACPSGTLTLVSPANNATVTSPVTFEWNAVANATSYTVFVIGSGGFEHQIFRTDTQAMDDLPAGDYQWWVVAVADFCPPVESSVRNLTVGSGACPTTSPDLYSPYDGETVTLPFLFEWSDVAGAASYIIHITGSNGFKRDIPTPLTFAPDDNYPPGKYTWKVEALSPGCDSTNSTKFDFYVEEDCLTESPEGLGPADDSEVESPVTFSWTAVTGAVVYELVVFDDYGLVIDDEIDGTSATYDLDPGYYDWFVLAWPDSDCEPTYSDDYYFSIPGDDACSGDGATLIGPADEANVSNPVDFEWSEVPGAYEYELVVVGLDNDDYEVVDTNEGETTATVVLTPGQYVWFVEAYLDCGEVESADAWIFTIGGGACDTEEPELVSPDDDEELTLPATFEWEPVPDAIGYWLVLVTDDGAPTVVAETGPDTTEATVDSLESGEYDWFVAALFADCEPTFSEDRYFEIGFDPACDHDEPYPLLPLDGSRDVPSPMTFSWTPVDGAAGYRVYVSTDGINFAQVGSQVTTPTLTAAVPEGQIFWEVEAVFDGCPSTFSEWGFCEASGAVGCGTPPRVIAGAVGSATSGESYTLYWSAVANGDSYEVQESATNDFKTPASQTTSGLAADFEHEVTEKTAFFYRVRGLASCNGSKGTWSAPVAVTVEPPSTAAGRVGYTSSLGTLQSIVQTLFVPGSGSAPIVGKVAPAPAASLTRRRPVRLGSQKYFEATTDRPWITVSPSSGLLPPEGVTLTVTMDPKGLPAGASGGTVFVSTSRGTGKSASATSGAAVPVTLSLVTPVSPATTVSSSAESIVLPALAASSNVVVGNLSAGALKYQINFSPESGGGTRQTSVQVAAGSTSEIDDVLGTWFTTGSTATTGSLEIRSVGASASTTSGPTTLASALVYATSANGTTTELVPGTSLSRFADKPVTALRSTTLTLPAVRKSSSYVTDLILVEGSGDPATAVVSISNSSGTKIDELTVDLAAREQKTISDIIASRSLAIDGARVDVDVTSAKGKVLALGNVRDLTSGDSWIVTPALGSDPSSTLWSLPGAADVTTTGGTLRTDMWIENRGASAVNATVRYDAEGSATPATVDVTLQPGETKILDKVISTTFQKTATRGAIRVTTPSAATLVVGGRTYVEGANGTLGGSLRSSTLEQTTALGSRALQIVHIENTDRARTDFGIAEVTGNAVTVDVTATVPGALASPKVTLQLQPNEFRRVGSILESMGLGRVYAGRLSVKVTAGTGRVAAYGSLVDLATGEPTFVPAE